MIVNSVTYRYILKNLLLLAFFVLVFAYDYFTEYLSFLEELIAVGFTVLFFFVSKIKLLRSEKTIIGLLFLILFLGLVSNAVTIEKIVPKAIALDALSFFKAFVAYFGVRVFFKELTFENIYPSLKRLAYFGLVIIFLLISADLIFDIFPKSSRFGFQSIELYFTHPSRLSFAVTFLFLLLYPNFVNKGKFFLLLILALGIVTLRVKFFGFIAIAVVFIYYKNIIVQIKKKYIILSIIPLVLIMFWVFKDWIMFYFSSEALRDGWSRAVLLRFSFIVSYEFFPLGTGFGSFGSFFSGPYYSWVYEYYNLEGIWGMQKDNYNFIADQYWPMVLGQFGVFGLFAMFGVIYTYVSLLLTYLKNQKSMFLKSSIFVALLGLVTLLIDSTSDAIFSQNRGVVIFMLIALIINSLVQNQEEDLKIKEENLS